MTGHMILSDPPPTPLKSGISNSRPVSEQQQGRQQRKMLFLEISNVCDS